MCITDRDGKRAYVDVKTRMDGQRNYSVKLGALEEYGQMSARVYIVWDNGEVDTKETLTARILGGPRRRNGTGSQTDWVLIRPGGTLFDEFFPSLERRLGVGVGTSELTSVTPQNRCE